jgi:ubiquinone/menaquinone biosynthesis C-methylase UbiE
LHSLGNVEFRAMDCQDLGFLPASFDVVLSNALLEYLVDVDAFMKAAFRILKPGGLFLCGTKNLLLSLRTAAGSPLYGNHVQEFTPLELRAALEKHYVDVKIYGERMKEPSKAFIMNASALKIERFLVAHGIKHQFPRSWRNYIRRLITGVNVDDITPADFEIVSDESYDALYIIGFGVKP